MLPSPSAAARCAAIAALLLHAPGAGAATPVVAVPLAELLEPVDGDAPARVISLNDGWLEAEIGAPVSAIRKRVGDAVASGETVLELDCRKYRRAQQLAEAQIGVLQARLSLAEQQLQRARGLRRSQSISEEVLNQRESEVSTLEAELRAQRVALAVAGDDVGRCAIRAPFAGVLLERSAQLGEMAAPGKRLARVLDISAVELSANLPVRDVDSLRDTEAARFSFNGTSYPVRVRAVLPEIDPLTATQDVRLEFAATPPPPGASGRLGWHLAAGVLPAQYLVRRSAAPGVPGAAQKLGVLVAREGRAVFVPIEGAREGRPARVDLDPATPVITAGRYGLAGGEAIEVRTDTAGAARADTSAAH